LEHQGLQHPRRSLIDRIRRAKDAGADAVAAARKAEADTKALRALVHRPPVVARAIAEKDAKLLSTLPEIGKRMAERVIAELDGKVDAFLVPGEGVASERGVRVEVKRVNAAFAGPAEDAVLAVEHGADVVYVSNHGGRQLDHAQGSIEVLAEVVKAVAGRAEVLADGGVQRGTDVVKMLCLGAKAVGVGKLLGLALSAGGEAGVARMLELMELEVRTVMGLMGVTSIKQLGPQWLREVPILGTPSSVSAYPLLEDAVRRNAR
jgi:glycolate oxidase